jgi:histidinol-phosphate aminotransferase
MVHPRSRDEIAAVTRVIHGAVDDQELRALGIAAAGVVDFSVNSHPLGPSRRALDAMAAVDVARYPDDGATDLRRALGKQYGVPVERLLIGNGSAELLWLICLAYVQPGDVVALLGPTFGEYERAARIMGGRVETFLTHPHEQFSVDVIRAKNWLREIRPKVVVLCNPNNPTGTYLEPDRVQDLIGASEETLVVLDEAYAGFLWGEGTGTGDRSEAGLRLMLPLLAQSNVVLVRSMTKDCALAGLRLGYAMASERIIDALARVKPPWSVNRAAQAAGLASLDDQVHLEQGRRVAVEAVTHLQTALRDLGVKVYATRTNFFLVDVGDGAQVRSALLPQGLVVRDCASFGLPHMIRVAARPLPECERLIQAMSRLVPGPLAQVATRGRKPG